MKKTINKIREKLKYYPVSWIIINRLARLGIEIRPFYLIKEKLNRNLKKKFNQGFEEYSCRYLNEDEIKLIANIKGHYISKKILLSWLKRGNKCLVLTCEEKLVAFTWFNLDKIDSIFMKRKLKPNEAYVFDAFTLESFRGKGLAPYLRYQIYKALVNKKKNVFYSVSEYFNKPAVQLKKKLNGEFLGLYIYLRIFDKWDKSFCLMKYNSNLDIKK